MDGLEVAGDTRILREREKERRTAMPVFLQHGGARRLWGSSTFLLFVVVVVA